MYNSENYAYRYIAKLTNQHEMLVNHNQSKGNKVKIYYWTILEYSINKASEVASRKTGNINITNVKAFGEKRA